MKRETVKMVCNECGKTKRVSPNALDPRCSCGSVDLDVAEDTPIRTYPVFNADGKQIRVTVPEN